MAISITYSSSGADYESSTTISMDNTLARGDLAIGYIFLVCIAADSDVAPNVVSVTDGINPDSYFITTVATANNSGNVAVSIGWAYVDSLPSGTDPLTVAIGGLGASEAKAASVYLVSGLDASPLDKQASTTGSGNSPSSGATDTLSQADELVIGAIGTEGPSDDNQGSWTTGTGYVSGNEQFDGTDSNGATANVCISSAAEVVSATAAQTAAKTGITSRDWAACVATLKGAAGGIQVTPAAAIANASVVSPSVVLGSTSSTPTNTEAKASAESPTVMLGSLSLTPALAEARASALNPAVIKGSISLTPGLAAAHAALLDPTVVLGSVNVAPALVNALASCVDPSVQAGGGVEVTPAFAEALASCLDPTVVLGSINITPAIAEALAACEDPAIVLGSVSSAPAIAEALASAEDPSTVLGSISLTPALASALASATDPIVTTGALYVTPAIAEALAAALAPSVVLGSVTIGPTVLEALALALDPNVIITGELPPRMRAINLFWTFGAGMTR